MVYDFNFFLVVMKEAQNCGFFQFAVKGNSKRTFV